MAQSFPLTDKGSANQEGEISCPIFPRKKAGKSLRPPETPPIDLLIDTFMEQEHPRGESLTSFSKPPEQLYQNGSLSIRRKTN